jgi:uncharacterized RDD family membrane protein YckC
MEVKTSYRLADISTRFFGFIIDSILVAAIGGAFGANDAWVLGGVISFIIGVGYQWIFLTRNNGQTPGKMFMGTRVVKADGTAITEIDVLMRYVGYLINSAVLGIGWLWAFIDPQKQGWHDKLARTYVVMAEREKVETVYAPKQKNSETV